MSYIIEEAKKNDILEILEIVESVHINNIRDISNGFLMNQYLTEESYKYLLDSSDYFLIARENENINGFLIAYSRNKILKKDDKDELDAFLLKKEREDFAYIFQIAVRPENQRQGIGRKLYKKLLEQTGGRKLLVITAKIPFNKASRNFHLKIGFKDRCTFLWNNGVESYVYELEN